jgi:hypothetical protein
MPYWRAMNLVTQLFAIVAVLFHVVAFVLESFLFHRPNVQTFCSAGRNRRLGYASGRSTRGFTTCSSRRVPPLGSLRNTPGIRASVERS